MDFINYNMLWALLLIVPFLLLLLRAIFLKREFYNSSKFRFFSYNSKFLNIFQLLLYNFLIILSFIIIIIALAEPIVKYKNKIEKFDNVRIFCLADVSGSMAFAQDVLPNRLDGMKKELTEFFNYLDGRYLVSIVPFAGTPNPYYCPLTYSKDILLDLTSKLSQEAAPSLGTDIPEVLKVVRNEISKSKFKGVNVVLLISDGGKEEIDESNRSGMNSVLTELRKNCKIYVVGVGGDSPAPLIKFEKGVATGFLTEKGKKIYSLLDESTLKGIAATTNGKYVRFKEVGALSVFLLDILEENQVLFDGNWKYSTIELAPYLYATSTFILGLIYFVLVKSKN